MKVMRDVNTIIFKLKYYFNRPRPHQYSNLDEIENVGAKALLIHQGTQPLEL